MPLAQVAEIRGKLGLDQPIAVSLEDLVRRAGGKPIRIASKSVRVPALLRRALAWSALGNLVGGIVLVTAVRLLRVIASCV